ncbi:hypothetical protein [Psychrilyobacter sp.]|uniref:hypothetical protein n=1 Tax=Psychrilyobacter sp. TaxID=2586924 RepID=UPI00301A1B24
MFQIDDIREKNIDKFHEIYLTGGKLKLIEALAEGLGKRSYFTINCNGMIKRKTMNHALPLITTINDDNYKEIIETLLDEMVDLTQREKIKKIERLSKYSLDSLTNNFNKILASGDKIFGLKYGKELFLRDRPLFFKMLFDYVLLEDIDSEKSTMAWTLYQLMKEIKDNYFSDEVFYVGISYILQKRSEFDDFERISCSSFTPTPKVEVIKVSQTMDSLAISSYGKMLNEFTYKKEEIYTEILKEKCEN